MPIMMASISELQSLLSNMWVDEIACVQHQAIHKMLYLTVALCYLPLAFLEFYAVH